MPHYRRHLFVCENERAPENPRGCCKARGSRALRARLKSALAQRGLNAFVRANAAGCLDQCEHGAVVCVYPEQVWYGGVGVDDVAEIIERPIIGGEYVERPMIANHPHLQGARAGAPLFAAGEPVPDGVDLTPSCDDDD